MRVRETFLALAVMTAASVAQAQSGYLWAGGGLAIPTGDAEKVLESGGMGTVGGGLNLSAVKGLSLQGELQFGSNSAKVGSGSTSYTNFFANLNYDFNSAEKLHPAIAVGIGSMSSKPKGGSSNSDMAYQLYAGLNYAMDPKWTLWGGVGYISAGDGASKMTLMPINVGISMSLGTP